MASNREDTLKQFCDVTGAGEERSRFFLDSSNWQLEMALSSFYEHSGNAEDVPPVPSANPAPIPVLSDSDMESPPGSPVMPQKMDKKSKNTANQRFATLSSLQQESSSDEEEGQAFYAGGSERSGQQIIGPGKNRRDIVSEMFKSVRERGAVVFEDEQQSSSSRGGGGPFGGTGYRLGQTADDHEPVSAPGNPQSQEGPRGVRLRLYREGFSVDNGPMRRYDDPENAEFLDCVRRGEIPRELSSGGAEVRVSLEDRRHEDAPRGAGANNRPFYGKGQMLGSPTPAVVGAPAATAAVAAVAAAPGEREANVAAAQAAVPLDAAQPATNIQIRLADGSRLTGRFNHSHTVATLRQFVSTASPAAQLQNFVLQTTFPSAELSDPNATIAEAGLLNSVVVQRLK